MVGLRVATASDGSDSEEDSGSTAFFFNAFSDGFDCTNGLLIFAFGVFCCSDSDSSDCSTFFLVAVDF